MPAEYCSLGLFRFNLEINKRLQFFKNDIIQSLDDKIESGIPELCVYPLSSLELDFNFIDMYPIICQMKNGKETLEQQFGITEEMMKTCSLIST